MERIKLSDFNLEWEDVDTLILKQFGEEDIAIRLAGIDAPEITHPDDPTEWFRFRQEQPFGRKNLERLEDLVGTDDLSIVVDPDARTYGRYIGLVYQSDNLEEGKEPLNMRLARAGLAASLPFGDSGSDIYPREQFMMAEAEAISANRGMWQSPFFQRYLDLSGGVGGRLTLNTLTDLSRTARNYHLAAAVEGLWSPDYVSPGKMRYIGQKLIPSYGRFFSGSDDAYNTIEGLPHGGLGQQMRRGMTEFGSGYIGKLIWASPGTGKTTLVRSTPSLIDYDDIFWQALGSSPVEKPGLIASLPKGVMKKVDNLILPALRQVKDQGGIALSGRVEHLPYADLAFLRDDPRFFSRTVTGALGGRENPIPTWTPEYAENKIQKYLSIIKQHNISHQILQPGEFLSTQPGFSQFSGFDDAYNTIEGLLHGGLGGEIRRIVSPFGSGWRGQAVVKSHDMWRFLEGIYGATPLEQTSMGSTWSSKGLIRFLKDWKQPLRKQGLEAERIELIRAAREAQEYGHSKIGLLNPVTADTATSVHEFVHQTMPAHIQGSLSRLSKKLYRQGDIDKKTGWYSKPSLFLEELYAYNRKPKLSGDIPDWIPYRQEIDNLFRQIDPLMKQNARFYADNIGTRANQFSGFDDAYNIIEGLLHGGQASKNRKSFGSGWQGQGDDTRTATFFFDLETGNKENPSKHQILTMGYKTSGGSAREVYTQVDPHFEISDWSRKHVLPQLEGKAAIPESELIQKFISRAQTADVISGYNINRFDIPWIQERARVLGMGSSLESVLSGKQVRDVGLEVQAALGRGMLAADSSSLRSSSVWNQWELMRTVARHHPDLSVSELAGEIPEGKLFQGWRLGTIHRALGLGGFAEHAAGADIVATEEIGRHLGKIAGGDPEFFSRWARYAPADYLAKGVWSRGESYDVQARVAKRMGLFSEFSELLADAGQTHQSSPRTPGSVPGPINYRNMAIAVGLGLGIPIIGSVLFSGRDDEYNTIQGLVHGGVAEQKRRELTEFGSGYTGSHYRGFVDETNYEQARQSTLKMLEKRSFAARHNLDPNTIITLWHGTTQQAASEILSEKAFFEQSIRGWRPFRFESNIQRLGGTRQYFYTFAQNSFEDPLEARTNAAAYALGQRYDSSPPALLKIRIPAGRVMAHGVESRLPPAVWEDIVSISKESLSAPAAIKESLKSVVKSVVPAPGAKAPSKTPLQYIIGGAIGVVGLSLLFSGKDDEYNTIPGLHPGAGPKSRWKDGFKEFGSGWIGQTFGSMKKFLSASRKEFIDKVAYVGRMMDSPSMVGIAEDSIPGAWAGITPNFDSSKMGVDKYIRVSDEAFSETAAIFGRSALTEAEKTTFLVHELSETRYSEHVIKKRVPEMVKGLSAENAYARWADEIDPALPAFRTHRSPAVIAEEALAAGKLGSFQQVRDLRFTELESVESVQRLYEDAVGFIAGDLPSSRFTGQLMAQVKKEVPASMLPVFEKKISSMSQEALLDKAINTSLSIEAKGIDFSYPARVRKIYATIEKNWLPKFEQAAQNRIMASGGSVVPEGLGHGGSISTGLNQTAPARKKTTPFGSGYDPVRALAKLAGQTFEEFTGSSVFKKALSEANDIGTLGKGSFGEVFQREMDVSGLRYLFGSSSSFNKAINEVGSSLFFAEKTYSPAKAHEAGLSWLTDLQHEAGILRELGETPSAPSLYGVFGEGKETAIMMEVMPGQRLSKINQAFPVDITRGMTSDIDETLTEAAKRGILNADLHGGNILLQHAEGRASIVDWGAANRLRVESDDALRIAMIKRTENALLAKPLPGMSDRTWRDPMHHVTEVPAISLRYIESDIATGGEHSARLFKADRSASSIESASTLKLVGNSKSTVRAKKKALSDTLKRAQSKIWDSAINGGKGHLNRNSTTRVIQ